MTKNAPTAKVTNGIENGMYAMVHNVTVCAKFVEGHNGIDSWEKEHYTITSHNGEMPAFHTSSYATIEELANAMRECADLRTWRLIDHS